jgi:putative transposase
MTSIEFKSGSRAWRRGQPVTIKAVLALDTVLVTTAEGRSETVPISELAAGPVADETTVQKSHDLADIDIKDWKEAERRAGVIGALDALGRPGRNAVEDAADKLGLGKSQVYELLMRWRDGGGVASALLPRRSGPQTGSMKISEEHRAIIESAIECIIKEHARVRVSKIVEEANRRFARAGIKPPSPTTIRKVFLERGTKAVVRAIRGKSAASKLDAVPGTYPETQYPLQVIQIDHTVVDVMVVDEVNRKPIQRPWLTLAVDVNTRMVTGFLLSMEPPSSASVALCLTHSVLPKEEWLARRGLLGNAAPGVPLRRENIRFLVAFSHLRHRH